MVVGGKLLALAYSATTTVTSTAATCFATLGSAAVGSTTFAARGFGTRPYAAGGGSGGEAGSRSTFAESTESTARSTDSTMSFFIDCFHQQNRRNQPALLKQLLTLDLLLEDMNIGIGKGMVKGNRSGCFTQSRSRFTHSRYIGY